MTWIFHCDATAATGLGHLSRCLALAEALRRRGGRAVFHGHWAGAAFTLLAASGFDFRGKVTPTGSAEDADALAELAANEDAAGAVADSYALDAAWLAELARRETAVALVDDFAQLGDYSDCAGVLNFTVGAERLVYPRLRSELRLAGPSYFPAREKLVRLRQGVRATMSAPLRRILIALGGGDVRGMTLPLYRAVRRLAPEAEVRALLPGGPAQAAAQGLDPADFPAAAPDLAAHYAWADGSVTGGGLTKYECAYLGLPQAIFSQTEAQQEETVRFCAAGGGLDLTPPGEAGAWEERLAEFLRGGAPASANRIAFRADSADRAMAGLAGFLRPVATSAL